MIHTFMIGNLTKDPDKISTGNGDMCKFSLAVNKRKKDETQFFNVTTFGKLAENCLKFLKKGSKISVSGEPSLREYEKDGAKKWAFEVIADQIEFLSSPKKQEDMKPVDDDIFPF